MINYFQTQGRALLANGYLIVPIRPGHKAPAIGAWQTARLGASDLGKFPGHGVGVLCGQGAHPIVGVDIDISHPTIGPAIIDWCRKHLGSGGERVGAAPRVLLTYRASSEGWTKGSSVAFFDPADPVKPNGKKNDQRVEMLGAGQQFVAYHVHPDTGRPYEWVDLVGGIEHLHASDLPVITEDQVGALMAEVQRLVAETPGLDTEKAAARAPGAAPAASDDDWFGNLSLPVGLTLEQAREYIALHDNVERDSWLRVGMALHHEFSGSDEALALWDEWSATATGSTAPNYTEDGCPGRWDSFGRNARAQTTMRWVIKIANQAKHDAELAGRREVLDDIKARIAAAEDSTNLTTDVARAVRKILPDDAAIRAEVFGAFAARFKALSGASLPVATLRGLLTDMGVPTVKQRRPLTEFGNAERMLDKYGVGLMYVPEIAAWYCWTGVYWRRTVDVEIEHYAKETVRALVAETADHPEPAEFFKFCAASQQAKMVRNMVALAASDPRVMVPAGELDKISHLLGVENGMVDLRTGALLDPDPEARITRVCAGEYRPGANASLFRQTVLDVFNGDEDMAGFFQRLIGYAAMGEPNQDIMVIPHGNGSNGKSTVLGTVRKAFGGYAKAAEASSFVSDPKGGGGGAGGAREDLVRLKGARFVYVNEPDENSELREGAVKAMTGGDEITARGVYAKASVEITPSWVVFMPTNHKPIVKGSDNGIWRRLMLIPFTRNFDADPTITKDTEREAKLAAELQGVLAWIIEGAIAYQRQGLAQPNVVRAAREDYRSQMDLLDEWLNSCCELGPNLTESSQALWLSWEQFARNRGLLNYVKNSIALGRRLETRFPSFKQSGGNRMRNGLRIREEFDLV